MRTLIMALALLSAMSGFANNDDTKKQINSIKKSSQYICAEAVAATDAEAKDMAEEMLNENINAWVATQKKMRGSHLIVNNKQSQWGTLAMPRGNMKRCFLYVKKTDIIAAETTEVIARTAPEPETKKGGTSVKPIVAPQVAKLMAFAEYKPFAEALMQMKKDGEVKQYARYDNLSDPSAYYLAIYDREGKMRALLSPGKDRTNLKTGNPDSVANYSGCGAIGFKL